MDEVRLIEVKEDIRADNEKKADELRSSLKAENAFLMNVMSSPGAGKTTLLMKSIERIKNDIKVGVMEADIDSKVDAEKMVAQGIPAIQLRTGGFCHLDANMVAKGLEAMDVKGLDLIVIENVGNLVCPAEFDTGAVLNMMLLSIPEGDDKPLKYPLMFSVCDVLVVTKMDYLSVSDFDLEAVRERAKKLNPNIRIFEVSAKTGEGMEDWTNWLKNEVIEFSK